MGKHVIFGAGQVGAGLAQTLAAAGHHVVVVRRSAAAVPGAAEVVAGDAMDRAFAIEAAAGADVVYHCMNPSAYDAEVWAAELPRLNEAVLAAAEAAGARLVALDNLYGTGVVDGARDEATPMAPVGPKGALRAAWDARLRASSARWVVGRAGDFFGEGAAAHSLISPDQLANLRRGWPVVLVGDPDASHAFSYVPDVVAGLAALGQAPADVERSVWHLPITQVTPRALVGAVADALGVPARVLRVPAWVVRLLGAVVPVLGELRETLYQWDRPFLAADQRFRERFPGVGSRLTDAARRTADALG